MKKNLLLTLLSFFLIFNFSFAQTADEIINKYIDAMGGKEKLAGLNSLKFTATVDIGPDMKAPMTMYFINNKGMRMEFEIQGMKMISAVEGDSGWMINPFGGKKEAERMDPEQIRQSQDEMDLAGSLFNYKQKGSTVEFIGKDDMEGTDTYKLKLTKKNGDVEYHYLDATSYLELKQTSKHKFKDKEVEGEVLYSNFRKVDGIMFPFTQENREVGSSQGQAVNIDKIEVNPKIDPAMFKMPKVEAAADKAPAGK